MVATKSLKKEYIISIVQKEMITRREALDLILHFTDDYFITQKYSRLELWNIFFKCKKNKAKRDHIMERARRYYREKYNLIPAKTIYNTKPSEIEEGEFRYDEKQNLYVWEDGEFKQVNYFD